MMLFKKPIAESKKLNAVYMWNMNPNERKPIPMKNIIKNERFFKTTIIGPNDADKLVNDLDIPNLKDLWSKIPWWIVKADLARLLYVYVNGGYYFDADCLVKKNLLPLTKKQMIVFVEKKLSTTNKLGPREKKSSDRKLRIANFAFGSGIKQHPFLKRVIDECLNRLSSFLEESPKDISEIDIVWLCGPDVITSVYHDYKDLHPNLTLLEKNYLNHKSYGSWRK